MAHAVRGILGLLHGAQGESGEQRRLRTALDLIQKLLQLLGMNLALLHLHMVTEVVDKGGQLLHLLRVGLVVVAVQEGQPLPVIVLRHGLVGDEHEILDDPRGRVPLIGPYLQGLPLGV